MAKFYMACTAISGISLVGSALLLMGVAALSVGCMAACGYAVVSVFILYSK